MYKSFVLNSKKATIFWTMVLTDVLTILVGFMTIGMKIINQRTVNVQIILLLVGLFNILDYIKYREKVVEYDINRNRKYDKYFRIHES